MKLADFPKVEALSAQEKLELVDELWLSLGPEIENLPVSEQEKQVLDERWAAFEKNPSSAMTLDEMKEKVANSRK